MPAARALGNIITFYSYKGGTGRTMALANTACVLAERMQADENVLVVDWDLEAPGLHQFLPARLRPRVAALDTGLGAEPGLIDLFVALRDALPDTEPASEDDANAAARAALDQIRIETFIGETEVPRIHIIRAGRNDDGGYSGRVNAFDWELLFRRAPTLYRRVAERLAQRYRYVLIDSRTGVTDISGICTSLLPEKLVVVFTPNRQSLTGVRELVARATAYRLGSDDLRPLLVYPLPSRIEVSMEKLNAQWRHGNPDAGITGYQPMFQALLKDCYALPACDLTTYFDEVQVQQSADCAYGEVISVRATTGDRLSLASSYRVFVERLLAPLPPWQTAPHAPDSATPTAAAPARPASTVPMPAAAPAAAAAAPVAARAAAPAKQVFLSYAREDQPRVQAVAAALTEKGYAVWSDRQLGAGIEFQQAVTAALDASEVVIVFWSRASIASDHVRAEAGEGSRRGVLLPVLLDDAFPPLEFRHLRATDLRRDGVAGLAALLAEVARLAQRRPVRDRPAGAEAVAPPTARRSAAGLAALAFGALVVAGAAAWYLGAARPGTVPPADVGASSPVAAASSPDPSRDPYGVTQRPPLVGVPDFKGRPTDDVQKVADVLGLTLAMTDERHTVEQRFLDGVVVAQSPAAGTQVAPQSTVTLTVATQTTTVPSVVGMPLGKALDTLQQNGLALGRSETVAGTQAPPGSVVRQTPAAGTAAPAGTKVDVGVAASPSRNLRNPYPGVPMK